MNKVSPISHESIARRAHQIWEEAGRREGNETLHWLQAEKELREQDESARAAKAALHGNSVEPPASGKHTLEQSRHSTNYVHPGVTTDSLHHLRKR
jgi:hypothetical protein